ncbi:hypothetical protein PMG11_10430 [Penicillium brasilianum]|uniref:Uncharacterized protein n=1 Tax=Penicillium brasilianum TaxID=104259 RepID=A0A0F7TYV7_PENBI|nr:hypothetical protein PMG11_10430 [Penicillium brasilianum]
MEKLRSLFVEGGRQQMPLPLKPEVEEYYIFCKTEVVNGHPALLWDQPMLGGTMSARLKNLGEIDGWLQSMFAHRMRYGGGKMLNNSDAVSEAQQSLIMKHADSRTFLNHYLPRHVDTDMQNMINGRPSNESLMRVVTRISRLIDTRRPRHLTPGQRASIREHPEYVEAVRRLDEQAEVCIYDPSEQMQLRRDKFAREKLNIFGLLERALRKKVRKEFDRKHANIDIERQLSGAAIYNEEAKLTFCEQTAGHCVDDVNGRLQAMSPTKSTKQWIIKQQRHLSLLLEYRRMNYFWRRRGTISERPKNLDDVFSVTAIPGCLFIVEHTNMANTNQLCDTFEESTWRIGDVICVVRTSCMKCIFADMQKMFIVLLPNAVITPKKNQDRTLIQTEPFNLFSWGDTSRLVDIRAAD